jgi:hypothetical protein
VQCAARQATHERMPLGYYHEFSWLDLSIT